MDKKTIEMLLADAEDKMKGAADAQERLLYACVSHYLEKKLDEMETTPKYVAYSRTNGPDRLMRE